MFVEITPDRVVVSLEVTPRHRQPYGLVHGGIYCALIETAVSAGGALWAVNQGFGGAVGVSNTTDFLRQVRTGTLRVVAVPIHRGRSQQLWEATVTRDSDGKLVAHGQVRLQNLDEIKEATGTA